MSAFRSMTIAFGRNITEDGGDFHTITVDDSHDSDDVNRVTETLTDFGYEVMSVVIDGYDFQEDMWQHIGYSSNIAEVLEALSNDEYSADDICAFLLEHDAADVADWHESIRFSAPDYEGIVREYAEVFHRVYEETTGECFGQSKFVETDSIPDFLVVDWIETAQYIAREDSASLVEFNNYLYYFG